jgi:flavin-dependent dehydrogenase
LVVGGGPAGAFFAIRMLRRARRSGRTIELFILEKKKEVQFYESSCSVSHREGCNYCAGGISPRLADILDDAGLTLPDQVLQSQVASLTIHGDWKNIELPIPPGRRMFSVFRGSRPRNRADRHVSFDSYLLGKAEEEGAKILTGEAYDIGHSDQGKPVVKYWIDSGRKRREESQESDFVVFAGGVNQIPGMELGDDCLFAALRRAIPGMRPPKVRRSLICELAVDENLARSVEGEVHFAQYGSKDFRIEMSSLIPKAEVITVVLLGRSVDTAGRSDNARIVKEFLQLPHIRGLLPARVDINPVCICNPNMTVGAASRPFGHRIALIGDMVVSRLYKDGILSAYLTASALVDCILYKGIDEASLKRGYWPLIKRFRRDVWFGRIVFLLSRITFGNPILSRILYQAVLTERRTKPQHARRLALLMWQIASGDDSYGRVLVSMFHPATVGRIAVGGFLVTCRNWLTEFIFGLKWGDFGRFPTGIPKEVFEAKRREFDDTFDVDDRRRRPDFESMYSIRIRGTSERIIRQLGKFGDRDRRYLRPRMVDVHRTSGKANQLGSTVQYDLPFRLLSFSVILECVIDGERLVYRVRDGFAEGGVLIFDLKEIREGVILLSIYVGFSFPRPRNPAKRAAWYAFRFAFPGFVHDVVWNHSLCKIKDLVETEEESPEHHERTYCQQPL